MARDQIFFGRQVLKEALIQKLPVKEIYFQAPGDRDFLDSILKGGIKIPVLKNLPKEVPQQHAQGVAFSLAHSFYLKALPQEFEVEFPRVLVLNHLQDVQNLGAIARSAAAFGFNLLVHESRRSFHLTPAAARISQGQAFRLKFWETSNHSSFLKVLEDRGFEIVGLDLDDAEDLYAWDPAQRVALLMGSEESGIQKNLKEKLHRRVKIPMARDVESLNVSQAASISMSWVYSKA